MYIYICDISENRPSGVIIDCNIVLSESIAYAAQQFGIALYDSLAKSHERLANQPGYIIDKNSIRFNSKYMAKEIMIIKWEVEWKRI